MTTCSAQTADLGRADRGHISWPLTGVGALDLVYASIEGGAWLALTLGDGQLTAIGYFAGPSYPSPGIAVVVPKTSHVRIRVVTTTETLTFDGGFIRLTP